MELSGLKFVRLGLLDKVAPAMKAMKKAAGATGLIASAAFTKVKSTKLKAKAR